LIFVEPKKSCQYLVIVAVVAYTVDACNQRDICYSRIVFGNANRFAVGTSE
jgi:hypothetical protein